MNARKLQRSQHERATKLWRKLRRQGHEHGLACLTCGAWLSEPVDDADRRALVLRNHQIVCPRTIVSALTMDQRTAPARHRERESKGALRRPAVSADQVAELDKATEHMDAATHFDGRPFFSAEHPVDRPRVVEPGEVLDVSGGDRLDAPGGLLVRGSLIARGNDDHGDE